MEDLLKFTQLSINADLGFWSRLYDNKLNHYKTKKIRTDIVADVKRYNHKTIIQLSSESFEDGINGKTIHERILKGDIYIVNTTEDLNKVFEIQNTSIMENMWFNINSGMALNNHQMLNKMTMSVYIDLKNYRFIFWIAFPVFKMGYNLKIHNRTSLKRLTSEVERVNIREQIRTSWEMIDCDTEFFVYTGNSVDPLTLDHIDDYLDELIVIANDMGCNEKHPSWLVRNLLFTLAYHITRPLALSLICYREDEVGNIDDSPCFDIYLTPTLTSELVYGDNGIPLYHNGFVQLSSKKGKPGLRDISSSMDINKLTESALDMNNRLMKWRVAPDLDLEKISHKKCLLIGAGTLGCHVARNLMAWGIKHITFLDCGTVSYSNPARQSLYFQDDIGKSKAETAAINLKKIYGNIKSYGINMKVPMPGYRSDDEAELHKTLSKFADIINEHDVIFLLTDTRESRWLPTLLAKSYDKLCLTAAIGFDTFVAVRHGRMFDEEGDDLGCYFCTDSLDISNTMINAPMDKRCTVTRPGVSGLAASTVAELMVSCIDNKSALTVLDDIPQQIRGNMSTFETKCYYTKQSECCIACSDKVLGLFKDDAFGFVKNVISYEGYLTDAMGLNIEELEIDDLDVYDSDDVNSVGSNDTVNGEDDLLERLRKINDTDSTINDSIAALENYNEEGLKLNKSLESGLIDDNSPLISRNIDPIVSRTVDGTESGEKLAETLREITNITLAKMNQPERVNTHNDIFSATDSDFNEMKPEDIEKSVNEMIESVENELISEGVLPSNGFPSVPDTKTQDKRENEVMEEARTLLKVAETILEDDKSSDDVIEIDLQEHEKELLLPIINNECVPKLRFISSDLAKKIYDSYSDYEQNRLKYIYLDDKNGYDYDDDY